MTLAEMIKSAGSMSIVKHTTAFAAGVPPPKIDAPSSRTFFHSQQLIHQKLQQLCLDLAQVKIIWAVKAKGTEIAPTGLAYITDKQIILKKGQPHQFT